MVERAISATEARVHFGELMDSVVRNDDIVYVERGGTPQVVVVSLAEWQRCGRRRGPWDGFMEEMDEHWSLLQAEQKAFQGEDFDAAELIRAGREERDEQLLGDLFGR